MPALGRGGRRKSNQRYARRKPVGGLIGQRFDSAHLHKKSLIAIKSGNYSDSSEGTGQQRDNFSWTGETPAQEKKMPKIKPLTRVQKESIYQPAFYPPRLVEGKVWYIVFYVLNPLTDKLKRIRIKFNRIRNKSQRRMLARELMRQLNYKLGTGWNPLISGTEKKSYTPLTIALDDYLTVKGKESEENSMREYRSLAKFLRNFLVDFHLPEQLPVNQFSEDIAADLIEALKLSDIGPQTYNNYLRRLKTLWNWFIEYKYAKQNPFLGFKRYPKKSYQKTRTTLTKEERQALFYLLEKENNNYLCICLLCYYCFMRPKEIVLLRVKHIDLEKQCVFVPGEIAKNDKDSVRTIPDAAMPFFRQLPLSGAEPEDFLFSWSNDWQFRPGATQCISRYLARYWNDFVRKRLGWGLEKQFYSLKDTGMTDMAGYLALPLVQGQADHSSLAITSIYIQKKMEVSEQIRTLAKKFTE